MIYYEVDFIPVGTGEKGGDAAAMRVWDDNGTQLVFVVDGGTKEAGEALVAQIQAQYGTSTVDAVICTHPDSDHASGLTEVLENLEVKQLFMHQPWDHADDIKHLFENRALTPLGLQRQIRKGLKAAYEVKKLADRKNILITEPYAGDIYFNGLLRFLGPSSTHYETMLPHFRQTPAPAQPLVPGLLGRALTQVGNATEAAVEWAAERMDLETLTDASDHFSAENSTSAISLFTFGAHKLLFTGDADIGALTQAAAYATSQNISLTDLHLLDVPHHGSKQNVGPTILNAIRAKTAHISAPPTSPKHPAKKVVNALLRRGAFVSTTQGKIIYYRSDNLSLRPGWSGVAGLTFSDFVEV